MEMRGTDKNGIVYLLMPDCPKWKLLALIGFNWEFQARASKEELLQLADNLGITWRK